MSFVFNIFFYKPLLNALVWLIGVLPYHDVGMAVILLTIFVHFLIFPFRHSATVTQHKIKKIEPELRKIKEDHKKDSQEQARKTMELYKQHGINPFSGFIGLLVQLPVIFALYKVFLGGVDFDPASLYSFISIPGIINTSFLGLIDVTQKSYFLASLAAIAHFFQMKLAMPAVSSKPKEGKSSFKDDLARNMSLQFKYVMPFLIFFIAVKFFSAVALYLITMSLFAIVHEVFVKKKAEKLG